MSEKSEQKNSFKLVLLGKSSVGKTCLIHRYIHHDFSANMSQTFGVAYYSKTISINGQEIKLLIWDTAGQERFNAISRMYYRRAKVAILCMDAMDAESYTKINYWIEELNNNEKDCKLYICCTKNDLFCEAKRMVTSGQIETSANIGRAKVFVTSSKSGQGVNELFDCIAKDLISIRNEETDSIDKLKIQLTSKKSKSKKKCCRRK